MRAVTVRPHPRRGFTLVELLVALVVGAVALTATLDVVVRQRRIYGDLAAERATRGRLREGADVLGGELRPLAPDDGPDPAADGRDLRALSDTAVEIRTLVGAAPACARVDDWTLDVARGADGAGLRLAAWRDAPQPGDTLLLLDARTDTTARDDAWRAWRIGDVGERADGCAATPLATLVPPGAHRLALAGSAPLPDTVDAGTPVRVLRPRRWSLYHAGDGRWYLGVRDREGVTWGPAQPVSGPYDRPKAGAPEQGGVQLADVAGDGRLLAAALRATRATTSGGSTARRMSRTDSLPLHAAPRNGTPGGG